MLKHGGNGVRLLPCPSHILPYLLLHYSKSLNKPILQPNSLSSVSSYLVESLGFSNQQAISTSGKLIRFTNKVSYLNVPANAVSVVNFFQQNGLNQSLIQKVVCSYPPILLARVDKTLKPKFEAFQELGLSASDITNIISFNPYILKNSLDCSILPAIRALRTVMCCDVDVFTVIKQSKWGSLNMFAKYLEPNVALFQRYAIPIELIQKWLLNQGRTIMLPTESLEGALTKAVHKWGLCRDSKMFLYGVQLLASHSEGSIELKCQVFKNFGWKDSDIVVIFRTNPYIFTSTEEKIKKRLNFLMKELGYGPTYLAANPSLFTYSLEKRLAPRHSILLLLKEKGLVKEDYSLLYAVTVSETKFLERFVRPFKDDIPNLHEIYVNSIGQPALGRGDNTCYKR